MSNYLTAAFYKFVDLPDFAELKAPLLSQCEANEVKGMTADAGSSSISRSRL